jgi:hypothetical protein
MSDTPKKYIVIGGMCTLPGAGEESTTYISPEELCDRYGINPQAAHFLDYTNPSDRKLLSYLLTDDPELMELGPASEEQYKEFRNINNMKGTIGEHELRQSTDDEDTEALSITPIS